MVKVTSTTTHHRGSAPGVGVGGGGGLNELRGRREGGVAATSEKNLADRFVTTIACLVLTLDTTMRLSLSSNISRGVFCLSHETTLTAPTEIAQPVQ